VILLLGEKQILEPHLIGKKLNFKELLLMFRFLLLISFSISLIACGEKEVTSEKKARDIFISTTQVKLIDFKEQESSMGVIKGLIDPTVAAEISGKVTKVYVRTGATVKKGELLAELESKDYRFQLNLAEAEIRRLTVKLENQNKILERNKTLVEQNFISPNALDNISSEKNEIFEMLEIAKANRDIAKSNLEKTKIYAPINGKIQKQLPSIGDFLKIGDGVYQIINNKKVRAHIPYPEQLANKIKPGMDIQLSSAISQSTITSKIAELKPSISQESRSIDVIADISNLPNWQPGSTVNGTIIFRSKKNIGVPEQSIVQRPLGKVVYVVTNKKVKANVVETGITQNGFVEILSGIQENDIVAVDGAAFLTDDLSVSISNPS
jgi:RND family efflux transporter MFP subunit